MNTKKNKKPRCWALWGLLGLAVLLAGCFSVQHERPADTQTETLKNAATASDTLLIPRIALEAEVCPRDDVACVNGAPLQIMPTEDAKQAKVMQMAREVLSQITTDDMTGMEVAFAIYHWTRTNITYVGTSNKDNWIAGAYQAFTERTGDCFNYFAAAKALYLAAGIDNVDVVRNGAGTVSHYWSLINLGEGWYHVDCTPRRKGGNFFMNTDAELMAYSAQHKGSHAFNGSLYPNRATRSVQHLVDYAAEKVYG